MDRWANSTHTHLHGHCAHTLKETPIASYATTNKMHVSLYHFVCPRLFLSFWRVIERGRLLRLIFLISWQPTVSSRKEETCPTPKAITFLVFTLWFNRTTFFHLDAVSTTLPFSFSSAIFQCWQKSRPGFNTCTKTTILIARCHQVNAVVHRIRSQLHPAIAWNGENTTTKRKQTWGPTWGCPSGKQCFLEIVKAYLM